VRGRERRRLRQCAPDEFDQREQVDGIERVGDQESPGRDHRALQVGRQQAGGARCDDDVRWCGAADVREDPLLEFELLRHVLLDEIGPACHRLEVGREREFAFRRQRRQRESRERRLRVRDRLAHPLLHFRADVRGDHVDAEVQCTRRPAAADDAGAEQAKGPHVSHCNTAAAFLCYGDNITTHGP
jgi:hypothetical protein